MKKRRLRDDERALWNQVARTAVPLRPAKDHTDIFDPEKSAPDPIQAVPFKITAPSKKQETRIPGPTTTPSPSRLDPKAFRKLSRGKLAPEGKIDLHGMTVDQAHPELINFILRSHAKGRRLVLVITGKGYGDGPVGPIPYQRGILKRQVPHWLRQNPVAPLILETTPAAPRHGGDGALYVYLRRRR